MVNEQTIGEKLMEIRARTDMSLTAVAKAAGYAGRSSVQDFFVRHYNPAYLDREIAGRLAKAFVGKGQPPVQEEEIMALAGLPPTNAAEPFDLGERTGQIGAMPRDIPIYGTALGGEIEFDQTNGDGVLSVEHTELDQSEVVGYLRRPPSLEGRQGLYGIYVQGSSMHPRFADGEAALVDPKRPPMIGDDVVVQLACPEDERVTHVLIKRLVRRSASFVELEQFSPALTFRVETARIQCIHRIVPVGELFS